MENKTKQKAVIQVSGLPYLDSHVKGIHLSTNKHSIAYWLSIS